MDVLSGYLISILSQTQPMATLFHGDQSQPIRCDLTEPRSGLSILGGSDTRKAYGSGGSLNRVSVAEHHQVGAPH